MPDLPPDCAALLIRQVAKAYHLEPALLHAVISAKSAYNEQVRSPKGARGLMQLMPETARRFGVSDPDEPVANLNGGARYLRWLLDFFADFRLALAGYSSITGSIAGRRSFNPGIWNEEEAT